jgi:hypothetical protein
VRGGTHYEPSFIPNPAFGGTLRGNDLVAWYALAWFDKYVKGVGGADARLLTDRWRIDPLSAAVDPDHDPNVLSVYHRSRLDIGLAAGGRYLCEDLRTLTGCGALAPDIGPVPYSVVDVVQAPEPSQTGSGADAARPWKQTTAMPGSGSAPPAAAGAQPAPLLDLRIPGVITIRVKLG